jgi:hypothetical protein
MVRKNTNTAEQPESTEQSVTTTTATTTATAISAERIAQMMSELKTKSAVIRALAAEGHKRSAIAAALNIRYQHVRNVLVQAAEKAERSKA